MLSFDDKEMNGISCHTNDPNYKKTEEKRQLYHMKELENELNTLERLSKFQVDIDYKLLKKVIDPNTNWIRVECCENKFEYSENDITYKELILQMAQTGNFKEFDDLVLEGFEKCETSLYIAIFS
jgi:hypothetical protein